MGLRAGHVAVILYRALRKLRVAHWKKGPLHRSEW